MLIQAFDRYHGHTFKDIFLFVISKRKLLAHLIIIAEANPSHEISWARKLYIYIVYKWCLILKLMFQGRWKKISEKNKKNRCDFRKYVYIYLLVLNTAGLVSLYFTIIMLTWVELTYYYKIEVWRQKSGSEATGQAEVWGGGGQGQRANEGSWANNVLLIKLHITKCYSNVCTYCVIEAWAPS